MKSTLAALLLAANAQAGWEFSPSLEVGAVQGKNIFHHLESANRKGLAESSGRVALVWEDNREGTPRCWLALRESRQTTFGKPKAIGKGECYEPVLQGIGQGRFVAAWEENGAVWVQLAGKGKPQRLSEQEAGQVTLTRVDDKVLYAAWAEQAGQHRRLMVARLSAGKTGLRLEYKLPVEDRLPEDEQAYPALAATADGSLTAVWEDRRMKHTMIMAAHSADGKSFAPPYRLIDVPQARSLALGAGMGSMRPTLAACGPACLVAAWLDKRDFLSGYDVYAAFSQDGGQRFGRNLKVQDSFGDNMAQWHAAVAANPRGRVLAVWDDDRDGTADVWLSDWQGQGFADNVAVPGAAGAGGQSDPIILLNESGTLHLAWLEKSGDGTRLKYASAVWKE